MTEKKTWQTKSSFWVRIQLIKTKFKTFRLIEKIFAFFKRIREHILSPISEKRIYAFINFRELTQNLWNSQNFPFTKDSDPKVQMINMDILQKRIVFENAKDYS